MSILKVARLGHPVLRVKTEPVAAADLQSPGFQQLIDDLIDTMVEYQGIGLAAPQVHEAVRLFVAGFEDGGDALRIVPFINPVISVSDPEMVEDWEGCLSIPDVRGRVARPRAILVKALDRHGEAFEMSLSDYPARVAMHETDHLDGVLFLDRMGSLETLTFLEEYGRYWHDRG